MLLDLLFPRFCLGCNTIGSYICKDCSLKIHIIRKDYCPYCDKPSFLGKRHDGCKGSLDGLISIFHYSGFIRTFIKSVKYKLQYVAWEELYRLIPQERVSVIKSLCQESSQPAIQPIPLHPKRLKERGFNQVTPFEEYMNVNLGLLSVNLIKRCKNTNSQAQIKRREDRAENIHNAFMTIQSKKLFNTIFLLDDVYTTGNTCKEAAKTLKSQGINNVYAITIARG